MSTARAANGLSGLGALGTVLGTGLLTVLDALRVEGAANDVVTHTRQVLHTAATHKHDRVLLKVVSLSRYVGVHFLLVCQTDTGNLTTLPS